MRDEHTKGRREGGANTEDWQKQSSSTVWCLNLHCLRYTPVTHHRSTLMTSNLTQGFGIGPGATPALVSGMRVILIRCGNTIQLAESFSCLSPQSGGREACSSIYRKSWCVVGNCHDWGETPAQSDSFTASGIFMNRKCLADKYYLSILLSYSYIHVTVCISSRGQSMQNCI